MQQQSSSTTTNPNASVSSLSLADRLIVALTPLVESLGYELVHLEVQTHRAKTVRLYIDHLTVTTDAVGIEDCAKVSRALDEPLEKIAETESLLSAGYELEVSSPGVDRPLRKASDYEKFKEREVRLHVFRPLTADELKNAAYFERNPKQKNYLGLLKGLRGESVLLSVSPSMGSTAKAGAKKKKAKAETEVRDEVEIPLKLISKANLEPNFNVLEEKP